MDTSFYKEKLLEIKKDLEKQLKYYESGDPFLVPDRNIENTLDEDITEIEGHDRNLANRVRLQEELQGVEVSLERIEKGTYGFCKNCNKQIPEGRLKLLPTATLCLDCEKK